MATDQPTSVFTKAIRINLCNILFCGGLWKPFEKPKWLQNIYSIYSVVLLTVFSAIYTAAMVMNIFLMTDDSDLSNRLFMSLTEVACAIKIYNFFVNNRVWQEILSEIESFRIKSPNEEQILQKRFYVFRILSNLYIWNAQLSLNALTVVTLLSGGTNLLFSGWYPGFDWKNNRRDFWIVFVYQYVGVIITAAVNVCIDSYYCFAMHILSAQANIIGYRMSSIEFDKEKDSIWEVRKNLIEQMTMHQHQDTIFGKIEENVRWAYFSQILLSSIVICASIREFADVNTYNRIRNKKKYTIFRV